MLGSHPQSSVGIGCNLALDIFKAAWVIVLCSKV